MLCCTQYNLSSEGQPIANYEEEAIYDHGLASVFSHCAQHNLLVSALRLTWRAQVDLILPEELYQNLQQAFSVIVLRYSRVTMSLSEIITGDFFNHYIKTGHHHHCYDDIKRDPHNDTGNIVMLSEGRPAVDNVFSLRDGTSLFLTLLRLLLDCFLTVSL